MRGYLNENIRRTGRDITASFTQPVLAGCAVTDFTPELVLKHLQIQGHQNAVFTFK